MARKQWISGFVWNQQIMWSNKLQEVIYVMQVYLLVSEEYLSEYNTILGSEFYINTLIMVLICWENQFSHWERIKTTYYQMTVLMMQKQNNIHILSSAITWSHHRHKSPSQQRNDPKSTLLTTSPWEGLGHSLLCFDHFFC